MEASRCTFHVVNVGCYQASRNIVLGLPSYCGGLADISPPGCQWHRSGRKTECDHEVLSIRLAGLPPKYFQLYIADKDFLPICIDPQARADCCLPKSFLPPLDSFTIQANLVPPSHHDKPLRIRQARQFHSPPPSHRDASSPSRCGSRRRRSLSSSTYSS